MVVSGTTSLAVCNWHTSNPECNAQLSVVSARAVRHGRADAAVTQIEALAETRQLRSRESLERFRKATIRRIHQQQSKCHVRKSQSESIIRANIEQYKIETENQICRLMTQHATQLESFNKAPLYRERDRVMAQSRSVRQHLLSLKEVGPDAAAQTEQAAVEPDPDRARSRIDKRVPFWARVPLHLKSVNDNSRIQLSKLEQARLAAAVRKWEMIQERYRARSEAKLVHRAKASSRPGSNRKAAAAVTIEKGSGEPGALDDDGIQRLSIGGVPSESAMRMARSKSYADSVRVKNRSALAATRTPRPSDHDRFQQLIGSELIRRVVKSSSSTGADLSRSLQCQ